jgi:hypothetical protein
MLYLGSQKKMEATFVDHKVLFSPAMLSSLKGMERLFDGERIDVNSDLPPKIRGLLNSALRQLRQQTLREKRLGAIVPFLNAIDVYPDGFKRTVGWNHEGQHLRDLTNIAQHRTSSLSFVFDMMSQSLLGTSTIEQSRYLASDLASIINNELVLEISATAISEIDYLKRSLNVPAYEIDARKRLAQFNNFENSKSQEILVYKNALQIGNFLRSNGFDPSKFFQLLHSFNSNAEITRGIFVKRSEDSYFVLLRSLEILEKISIRNISITDLQTHLLSKMKSENEGGNPILGINIRSRDTKIVSTQHQQFKEFLDSSRNYYEDLLQAQIYSPPISEMITSTFGLVEGVENNLWCIPNSYDLGSLRSPVIRILFSIKAAEIRILQHLMFSSGSILEFDYTKPYKIFQLDERTELIIPRWSLNGSALSDLRTALEPKGDAILKACIDIAIENLNNYRKIRSEQLRSSRHKIGL